jgi:hypothetical protein
MKNLERRIQKIEERVPQLPCPNPEHERIRIFMYGVTPEQDRDNDDLIESIENCDNCKAKASQSTGPAIIKFRSFATDDGGIPKNLPARERTQEVAFMIRGE